MIPLFEKDGFIITFDSEPERYVSRRHHFIDECGWTEDQFAEIKDFDWFSAKVGAWKGGEELGTAYLGCCCYKTSREFYTTHKDDYFADMVDEAISEARSRL